MDCFTNTEGKPILLDMIKVVQNNKAYLGEVDGLIGDGDHGMNMNKGFTLFEKRIADKGISFSEGLDLLGNILLTEIGGSMGPIYGTIFMSMSEKCDNAEKIDLKLFADMMVEGLSELYTIVDARVGDKTLVDTLSPACDVLKKDASLSMSFTNALQEMKEAAVKGKDSTKELVARYGRSSRLGERSRGVLDAGATSCCLILVAMADGIIALL